MKNAQAPTQIPNGPEQLSLFAAIQQTYASIGDVGLDNNALYGSLVKTGAVDAESLERCATKGGQNINTTKRSVRWHQQTLKHMGLLERVPGERGRWRPTTQGRQQLTKAQPGVAMLAYETQWGFAIWADCHSFFAGFREDVHLVLSSPPYPLARARAYGGPQEAEYVDFIVRTLEPLVKRLVNGGSICLNISNDVFEIGKPSRSFYRERLLLALHEKLGLHRMDTIVWHNASKAPGPIAWASKKRVQLNVAWEPLDWLTTDPMACRSDNRRILKPHTERHLQLIEQGGEQREGEWGDGAYRLRHGSFGAATEGAIERNVWSIGHSCASQRSLRRWQVENGYPQHGAVMPLALADRAVRFLSEEGDLVVDPFGGSFTVAEACENNARRWVSTEQALEYAMGSRGRFLVKP